jgi:hypothetical protein
MPATIPDLARQDFLRRLTQATRPGQISWHQDPLPLWDLPWSASCLYNGESLFWLWPPTPEQPAGLAALESWGPRWLASERDCPYDLLFELEQAIAESNFAAA